MEILKFEINECWETFCNVLYSVIWIFVDDHNARTATSVME